MESGGQAYGAGKAGVPFDPISFIKQPQVILRAVSLFFAIIVFGCISSQSWYLDKCQFNDDPNACGFGVAIGVIAFLGLAALLVLDALFNNISSIQQRKYVVMADLGFSGAMAFFWFVTFCYLTDSWRKSTVKAPDGKGKSGSEAAIAFSFFSIATFAGLTFFAVQKYRKGAADAFGSTFDQDAAGEQQTPSPYPAYPGGENMGGGGGGMGGGMGGNMGGGGGMGGNMGGGGMGGNMGGGGMGPGMGGNMGGGGGMAGGPYQQAPFSEEKKGPLPGEYGAPTY